MASSESKKDEYPKWKLKENESRSMFSAYTFFENVFKLRLANMQRAAIKFGIQAHITR